MYDAGMRTPTILCVEDDEESREILSAILNEYSLSFARNGYEAIRSLNSGVFDLYLLDLWLPDWSGVQLCRHIRQKDPRGPIVFCTGAIREEERRRAMNAGASAFLTKPVDPQAMRDVVGELLTRASAESLHALVEEERAIHEELGKRAEEMRKRSAAALESARGAIERATRLKALKVFLDAGGTLGHFEREWTPTYQSAWTRRSEDQG
jgi:CheY-like chemotaxis protein